MPLPWVRLDTSMPDNPKILDLVDTHGEAGLAAAFVWCCSLAYSGKHGTDGLITRATLPRINGKPKHANLLVGVRLWDADPAGWRIHGYAEYQMLVAAEMDMRQAASVGGATAASRMSAEERSERGRKAARTRWGRRQDSA